MQGLPCRIFVDKHVSSYYFAIENVALVLYFRKQVSDREAAGATTRSQQTRAAALRIERDACSVLPMLYCLLDICLRGPYSDL